MLLQYILQSIWSFVIWYIMPGLSAVNVLQSPSGQISDGLCFVRPSSISRQIILVPEWRHVFQHLIWCVNMMSFTAVSTSHTSLADLIRIAEMVYQWKKIDLWKSFLRPFQNCVRQICAHTVHKSCHAKGACTWVGKNVSHHLIFCNQCSTRAIRDIPK